MMKLWLLKPQTDDRTLFSYDCAHGFVVRAETVDDARQYAAAMAGDEGAKTWLDDKYTSCEVLVAEGEPGVVLLDFLSG